MSKIIVATLLCLKLKTRNLFTLLHFNAHAVTLTPHQWLHSTVMVDMLPSPARLFPEGLPCFTAKLTHACLSHAWIQI